MFHTLAAAVLREQLRSFVTVFCLVSLIPYIWFCNFIMINQLASGWLVMQFAQISLLWSLYVFTGVSRQV